MTRQDVNSAHPHDPDADRLSAAWNDIVEGSPSSTDSVDAELIATVRSLHASAPDHRPQSEFRDNLREQLMDTAVPITMPGRAQRVQARDEFIGVRPIGAARSRIPQSLRGTAVRWVAIAATIALLVTTAFGAWRGGLIPSDQRPHGTIVAAPYAGTPEALGTPEGIVDPCSDRYTALPNGLDPWIGGGLIAGPSIPEENLSVTKIQMQSWELESGEQVASADTNSELRGVGVDVVINGAYAATFSTQVTVSRPIPGGGGEQFDYVDANAEVELSRGDVVTYQLGSRIEVRNQFQSQMLQFQTILFYEGQLPQVSPAASTRFESRIEGEGTLAKALNEYPSKDIRVLVTFLGQGCAIPRGNGAHRVLGPVPTSIYSGEAPGQGFVVWLAVTMG